MSYTGSKAIAGQSTQLQRGDGGGTEAFTTVAEITKIQGSGSKADIIDTTNMDSTSAFREKLPTLLDAGEISFEAHFIAADAQQQGLRTDFNNRTKRNFKIVLPNTLGTWSFAAYVSALDFDIPVDKEVMVSGKLTITGPNTFTPGV